MMGTLGGARPDFATEAMGINEGDTYLILRPMSTWKRFQTKEELIAALDKALSDSARHRLRFHAAHAHPYRRNRLWPSKRIWPSKSSATTSTRRIASASRSGSIAQFESRAEPIPRILPASISCTIATIRKFRRFAVSVLTLRSLEKVPPRSIVPT